MSKLEMQFIIHSMWAEFYKMKAVLEKEQNYATIQTYRMEKYIADMEQEIISMQKIVDSIEVMEQIKVPKTKETPNEVG